MRAPRSKARWLALGATFASVAACNALNGSVDRALEEDAAKTPSVPDAGDARLVDASVLPVDSSKPSFDASDSANPPGSIAIDFTTATSLNDASFTATPTSLRITAFEATHPVVVFDGSRIPSEDFTVYATIRAPVDGEFGIVARIQPKLLQAYVLGSEYGITHRAFMGQISATDWNPSDDANATMTPSWAFVANHEYVFMMKLSGPTLTGKMWDPSVSNEPAFPQLTVTTPFNTGKDIGFYVYENGALNTALLENMHVTVP